MSILINIGIASFLFFAGLGVMFLLIGLGERISKSKKVRKHDR